MGRKKRKNNALILGRLVVQQSADIGSDPYMRQEMYDIISILNYVVNPYVFITLTYNTKGSTVGSIGGR